MSTDAERQRRSRRHRAGDHTLCTPSRCEFAGQGPVMATASRGVTFAARGERLWRDLKGDDFAPAQRVLLEEACRIADRLDKLDRLLSGDARDWVGLVEDKGDPERLLVVIDRPLAEARQQATALKQVLAEIRAAGAVKPTARPAAAPAGASGKGVAGVTALATWTPTRSAKSTG